MCWPSARDKPDVNTSQFTHGPEDSMENYTHKLPLKPHKSPVTQLKKVQAKTVSVIRTSGEVIEGLSLRKGEEEKRFGQDRG